LNFVLRFAIICVWEYLVFSKKKKIIESKYAKRRVELEELGLTTLDDLEALVKPLLLDAIRIIPKKATALEGSNLKSHIGGIPYFEKGEVWPKSEDGIYLQFIFQIFNDGNLGLPESIKLLQFYYAIDGEYMAFVTEDSGWHVKAYENLDSKNMVIVDKPKDEHFEEWDNVEYCELGFEQIKSLPMWWSLERYSKNAFNLSCLLNEKKPYENYNKIELKLLGRKQDTDSDVYLSQIGGYPA